MSVFVMHFFLSLLLLPLKPEDGSIVFKIFKNRGAAMLIGMDQWRAVVNVAVKPRIAQRRGNVLTSCRISTSQKEFCCIGFGPPLMVRLTTRLTTY